MRRILEGRSTPALLVAMAAVVLSLGGVSFAAMKLSKNQVKKHHIAKAAVGTSEVANRSLKEADLTAGAAAAVQTGVVNAAGTTTANPKVSVSKSETGRYVLEFAQGTWTNEGKPLAMTVSPFGIGGDVVTGIVEGGQRRADGSATFTVVMSSTTGTLTLRDNGFMFIASTTGG